MATPYPTVAPSAAPPSVRWVPLLASGSMTAAFAYCAFRLSFAALTELAVAHGAAGADAAGTRRR